MKKTMMMILVALVATLILSGCNNSPATATTQQPTATAPYEAVQVSTTAAPSTTQSFTAEEPVIEEPFIEEPVVEEPAAPAVEVEWQTLSYTWEDEAGYKFEATVKVSPWITTENSDYLNSAWNEVGNGNTLPKADPKVWGLKKLGNGKYYATDDNRDGFRPINNITDMYYCVGEISIRNLTEGWDIASDSSITSNPVWLSACQPETNPKRVKKHPSEVYEWTSSCTMGKLFGKNKEITSSTWISVNPVYTSNKWSTSFAFAHCDNKTPKNPDGEGMAEMQDTYFCIDGTPQVWAKEMNEVLVLKLDVIK